MLALRLTIGCLLLHCSLYQVIRVMYLSETIVLIVCLEFQTRWRIVNPGVRRMNMSLSLVASDRRGKEKLSI